MTIGYLRQPHLQARDQGDLVTFVAADDVWLAPATGGRAWRLSADRVPVGSPRFSPDGSMVAWASSRDGRMEVLVAPIDGSTGARRLTWWGSATTKVLGWTDDQRVLVASAGGEANLRLAFVKAVGLDGRIEPMPWGPASGVAVRADGAVVVSTPGSRAPAHWKRYRGGTASKLWLSRDTVGAAADLDWEPLLPEVTAGLVSPSWLGDRLVFASDLETDPGSGLPGRGDVQADLFSLSVDDLAAGPTRLTHHTPDQGYVRDPATDGSRVVYTARGMLFVLAGPTSAGAVPEAVEIALGAGVPARSPRPLAPTENLETVSPDHGGDLSVVGWRGAAYALTHRDGPARALSAAPGVRVREPQPLGRTRAVGVSDADGEDRLEIWSLSGDEGPRVLVPAGVLGRVLWLQVSPDGSRVATVSHDGRVSVVDVAGETVTLLATSDRGEAEGLAFSPDGRYLAWCQPGLGDPHQVLLADLSAERPDVAPVTSGRFDDTAPCFTADGKHLVLLSARTFDPAYDTVTFDLTFPASTRPYLVPLQATEAAPFGPSVEGRRRAPSSEDSGAGKPGAEQAPTGGPGSPPVSPDVDREGFEERITAFPVPAGHYRDVRASASGVLWVHEAGGAGVLGSGRAGVEQEPPADTLEHFDLTERTLVTVAGKVDGYAVSGDRRTVVVRDGETVKALPADRAAKDDADDPSVVTIDLSRLRRTLDPVAEWRQMLDEAGRLMRDHYWRADLDGVDWDATVARYRPVVDRLCSHDDLVDLLWELGAELNTSHAYVQPAAPERDATRQLGLLGADLAPSDDGWVIAAILPGESSDPSARSPLRAAGVGARVADLVVAVDGASVDPVAGPAAGLLGAAGKPVELTLRRDGADRRVAVVPLEDDEPLRYQAWVASRAAYVAEHGQGRLGYLHIPDMMGLGWAQLHRDLELATAAEGLVVDVRFNRGGHTSQLVLERLARKVIGWDLGRHHATPMPYPSQSPRGPVVVLANEFSGSDGDIINAAAQAVGLGPVIGVRTWGGVVGIDGRFGLVDGTGVTQPRYAFWLQRYGWQVENHGVDPDIEVAMTPADWHSETDKQLDRGISELLARLESTPAATPPPVAPPRVRGS